MNNINTIDPNNEHYKEIYQKQNECTDEYPNSWLEDICTKIKQLWDTVVINWNKTKISASVDQRVNELNWNYAAVWSEHEFEWLYTIIFETELFKTQYKLLINNNCTDGACTYAFYLWDVKMPHQTFVMKYFWILNTLEESFNDELKRRNQEDALKNKTTDELLDTIS